MRAELNNQEKRITEEYKTIITEKDKQINRLLDLLGNK